MSAKYTYVCATCGSDDVSSDATARWSVKKQDWVLSDLFDSTYCYECQDFCEVETKDIK